MVPQLSRSLPAALPLEVKVPHRWRRRTVPLLALPLFALATCGDAPAGQRAGAAPNSATGAAEIVISGDTVIRYVGAPRYPAGGTLAQDLTIRLVDGPDEYIFGQVQDVALGAGGHIYVLDRQAQIVREYDARGTHVQDVARPGEGPGELQDGYALTVANDGKLYVGDIRARLVHRYSANGEYETDYLFRPRDLGEKITVDTAGVIYLPMDDYHPRFTFFGARLLIDTLPNAWGVSMSTIPAFFTFRISPDGAGMDSIDFPDLPDLDTYYTRTQTYTRGPRTGSTYQERATLQMDHYPHSWWDWSPVGAMVIGRTDVYAIDFHYPRGVAGPSQGVESAMGSDSIVSLRRRVDPISLDPAERDLLREQRAFVERNGPAGSSPGVWHGPDEPPHVKPAYHAAILGQDGSLWLLVPGRSEQVPGSVRWREVGAAFDVYDPSRNYLGAVPYPADDFMPTTLRGDTALTIVWDEMGVQTVQRWVIRWGGG